jgi:hypothetical protein
MFCANGLTSGVSGVSKPCAKRVSVDSREVAPGVVLDFDAGGCLVGIDIDCASRIIDLSRLEAEALPINSLSLMGS